MSHTGESWLRSQHRNDHYIRWNVLLCKIKHRSDNFITNFLYVTENVRSSWTHRKHSIFLCPKVRWPQHCPEDPLAHVLQLAVYIIPRRRDPSWSCHSLWRPRDGGSSHHWSKYISRTSHTYVWDVLVYIVFFSWTDHILNSNFQMTNFVITNPWGGGQRAPKSNFYYNFLFS